MKFVPTIVHLCMYSVCTVYLNTKSQIYTSVMTQYSLNSKYACEFVNREIQHSNGEKNEALFSKLGVE